MNFRPFVVALVVTLCACPGPVVVPGGVGAECSATVPCATPNLCVSGQCAAPSVIDAGTPRDSGTAIDAGTTIDAGAETHDAGTNETVDAGTSQIDAGTGSNDGGTTGGCGPCNTPPGACYGQGACVAGRCEYPFVEGASCDDSNACTIADTCHNNACTGIAKACDTPPGSLCTNATTVQTYDATGSCNAGLCVYTSHTITCSTGGCRDNQCVADACGSVTCNTPPSVCYAATGTCSGAGQCSYGFNNAALCNDNNACTTGDSCNSGVCQGTPMACNTPPADVCTDASTLRSYTRVGSCAVGTCSYTSSLITCPNGCASGACTGGTWALLESGTQQDLTAVWGVSGSEVWAAGTSGTLLFYNGSTWQSRISGTTLHFKTISGTSSSNIFATAERNTSAALRHFDGTAWAEVPYSLTGQTYSSYQACVGAVGDKEAIAAVALYRAPKEVRVVFRIKKVADTWVTTELGSFDLSSGNSGDPCVISVLNANEAFISGGGTKRISQGAVISAFDGGTASSDAVYAGSTTAAVAVTGSSSVSVLSSTGWSLANVGFQAATVHGTSPTRVFLAGSTFGNNMYSPKVSLFDGLGFSALTMPSAATNAGYLNAVYALPTGEVIAVGNHGLILKGP